MMIYELLFVWHVHWCFNSFNSLSVKCLLSYCCAATEELPYLSDVEVIVWRTAVSHTKKLKSQLLWTAIKYF